MLLDARSIAPGDTIPTDVCIVGAGAAGITAALGLRGRGARVLLLEGGGEKQAAAAQVLCEGTSSGRPYYALDACRLRCLGGSTNVWGGWCRPLDAIDFEERDWVPHSGWPFTKSDLDPYYGRAQAVCRLGPCEHDGASWRPPRGAGLLAHDSATLRDTVFRIVPSRFGAEYGAALRRAPDISLMLHGNAVEIEMDPSRRTAERIHVATLAGNRFAVRARFVVLAAGGIENPRLLLASRRGSSCGIGNEHDLVGRFFADHLHVPIGLLRAPRGVAMRFYAGHRSNGAIVRGGIGLSEEVTRRERLLGCAVTLHNSADPHDVLSPTEQPASYRSLRYLMTSLARRERPDRVWHHAGHVVSDLNDAATLAYRRIVKPAARTLLVGIRSEQAPNPTCRVTLDDRRDSFDMPRARLHWDVMRQDADSLERSVEILRGAFARQGLVLEPLARNGEPWCDRAAGGAHHTGTTRMHRDPTRGVVDEHGRVHGTRNVYVAGSSVFPTAGWAPPTLTIVALAARLAEHLKERLAERAGG